MDGNLKNFIDSGFYSIELLVLQMLSKY